MRRRVIIALALLLLGWGCGGGGDGNGNDGPGSGKEVLGYVRSIDLARQTISFDETTIVRGGVAAREACERDGLINCAETGDAYETNEDKSERGIRVSSSARFDVALAATQTPIDLSELHRLREGYEATNAGVPSEALFSLTLRDNVVQGGRWVG